jgi:hypothetical protein
MKKYFPILFAFIILGIVAFLLFFKKNQVSSLSSISQDPLNIGIFQKEKSCAIAPKFLKDMHIPSPYLIDLSQKKYRGIALYYGKGLHNVLHAKQWEEYGHFSTYSVDKKGNIYLAPMPFISIEKKTFMRQKSIYRLSSRTGIVTPFMTLDDIVPNKNNPYGISAIAYDCSDESLWVAAIDETDYRHEKGVIYHIDIKQKRVLNKIEGFDALSLTLMQSSKGKYLLAGSARDSGLYAFAILNHSIQLPAMPLLKLPDATQHIRKIRVSNTNTLMLESIEFNYSLIVQTTREDRMVTYATWEEEGEKWKMQLKQ